MVNLNVMTHHTPGHPTGHHGKANEQEEPGPPHRSRIPKSFLTLDAVLVNEVDDDHPEQGADAREPVDKGDVHRRRDLRLVVRWVRVRGENRCIEERPVCQRKLSQTICIGLH